MHWTGERACSAEETRHSCSQSRDVRGDSESRTVAIVEMVMRGAGAFLTLPRFHVHQTHAAFRLRSKSAGDR